MRITKLLVVSILLLCIFACERGVVFEDGLKIKNAQWERSEKAMFEFTIDDTTAVYDFYLNFRHGSEYPYQNIYLFTQTKSPSNQLAVDTAQMLLADKKGRWMGKGIGDIFDYEFKFKQGRLFPEAGVYTFQIEQAMRDKTLPYITDIGISIKKVNP